MTKSTLKLTLLIAIFTALLPCLSTAADVNARYPFRMPDWFWQSPDQAHLLTPVDIISLQADCKQLKSLQDLTDSSAADSLEESIVKRLSSKFALRDLAVGSYIASNEVTGTSLAVQLDPTFDEKTKTMLEKAAVLFLSVALDEEVIKRAYARSTSTLSPMPEKYEMKDGQPAKDEVERPRFTKDYAFYLKQRAKPSSTIAFAKQLGDALTLQGGDSTVLFVSQYSGNVWWGGAYYGFFNDAAQQASRDAPSRGYLYIRLNTDKLTKPEPHWDEAAFWASKMAHEILHNLAFWHPNYKDPAEREANNHDNQWAFIVSYEAAIYDKLKSP